MARVSTPSPRVPLSRPHAGTLQQAWRLRPDLRSEGRSRCRPASHCRRCRHCARAIVLQALGERLGINRAGYFVQPMDESLAVVAVDLGGRPALVYNSSVTVVMVGDLQVEFLDDFLAASRTMRARTCMRRSSMAAPTITKLRPSSNASPVRCGMPAQRMND